MNVFAKLFSVLFAIIIGSGGVIGLFYLANYLVNLLPSKWRSHVLPWVYLSPAIFVLTAYLVIPTIYTIYLSFLDARSQKFVALANYTFAFTNKVMLVAFKNNLLWLVLVTGISVSLGLILAVLMDKVRYEPIVKSLIFLPMAISFVGASVIWKFIYAYRPEGAEQIGILNALLVNFGWEPVGWLVEKSVNNFALIAIMIWLQTGFALVILSAAVKGIPKDVIEAAKIDGVNEFQIFWKVIIPMISSTILVVTTTIVILVLKVF